MNNLENLFSIDYPTVETFAKFKIVGPVNLPIKIKDSRKGKLECFLFSGEKENYLACIFGEIKNSKDVLVRVSSACVFGFILNSLLCDCKNQFEEAIERMLDSKSGILIFGIDQHGKGIGLDAHFLVYAEGQRRNKGLFTEIYEDLGLKLDYREYDEMMSIINYLVNKNSIEKITMLTEAPEKRNFFQEKCAEYGITVEFDKFNTDVTPENKAELSEKVAIGYEIANYL